MSENTITIDVVGTAKALDALKLRHGSVRRGARIAMDKTTFRIRGRVKESFGQAGKPRVISRALSRSITSRVEGTEDAIVGQVGSTMPYKTGYAAILEKGGPIPEIKPKKGKYLRFLRATGFAGMAYDAALGSGATGTKARKAAIRVHRSMTGLRGKALDRQAFVYVKKVPARYQRAMPYLHPAFDAERPLIPETFKKAIDAALAGGAAGTGAGGQG